MIFVKLKYEKIIMMRMKDNIKYVYFINYLSNMKLNSELIFAFYFTTLKKKKKSQGLDL